MQTKSLENIFMNGLVSELLSKINRIVQLQIIHIFGKTRNYSANRMNEIMEK